jgi:hypothetical protein
VFGYRFALVFASAYDPVSGLALFPLTGGAPRLGAGKVGGEFVASDFQEAKNINTSGRDIMPNTAFRDITLHVVRRPTVTWLLPRAGGCAGRRARLVVAASATTGLRPIAFHDGTRLVARGRRDPNGLYEGTWTTAGARRGKHAITAVVSDATGRQATATRTVRVCR